jgi:hypothetical protein
VHDPADLAEVIDLECLDLTLLVLRRMRRSRTRIVPESARRASSVAISPVKFAVPGGISTTR